MTKFIVLTLDDPHGKRKAKPPARISSPRKKFQDWAVGDVIVRKSNRHDRLQITDVAGGRMGYGLEVQVTNLTSGDSRTYNSSTLQTAFEHEPQSSLDDPATAVMPKDGARCAFNVDQIRNFYPRTRGRMGTRIMTSTGVAYAVLEDFDDVLRLSTGTVDAEEDAEA